MGSGANNLEHAWRTLKHTWAPHLSGTPGRGRFESGGARDAETGGFGSTWCVSVKVRVGSRGRVKARDGQGNCALLVLREWECGGLAAPLALRSEHLEARPRHGQWGCRLRTHAAWLAKIMVANTTLVL